MCASAVSMCCHGAHPQPCVVRVAPVILNALDATITPMRCHGAPVDHALRSWVVATDSKSALMQFIVGPFCDAASWSTDSTASSVDTQLIRWHLFRANLHVQTCQGLSPRGSLSSVGTCPGASTCGSVLDAALGGTAAPFSSRTSMNHAAMGSAPYGSIAEISELPGRDSPNDAALERSLGCQSSVIAYEHDPLALLEVRSTAAAPGCCDHTVCQIVRPRSWCT